MNRNEYLNELGLLLSGIPEEEIEDIIYDFREFFNAGMQDGRSEQELVASLGEPKALAKQVKAEYMVKLAKATPSFHNMYNAIIATMGLTFFKVIGSTLIFVGFLLLLDQIGIVNMTWAKIWPIFLIGIGLSFEVSYFTNPMRSKANVSLLIPGGILTVSGSLFLFLVFTNYGYLVQLWPIFILSTAFGLFQFYYYGDKIVWILLPVVILTGVGGIFFVRNVFGPTAFSILIAIFLILSGIFVWIFAGRKRNL